MVATDVQPAATNVYFSDLCSLYRLFSKVGENCYGQCI